MKPVVKRPITIMLTILYILDAYKKDTPESVLSTLMLDDIDVNYFDYRSVLAKLEETGYVNTYKDENGHEYHQLFVSGKELIDSSYKKLAYELRCNIIDYIRREKRKTLKANEFVCEIIPQNDADYLVKVTYNETDDELLSVSFRAGNRKIAEGYAELMRSHKNELFGEINAAIARALEPPKDDKEDTKPSDT